jgi:ACS family D-galactonate transporter-like MFS transporter
MNPVKPIVPVQETDKTLIAPVTNTHRWAIVGLLFTASMINYMDRATVSFALPLISKELSLGPMTKGLLLSAFFWSYALMQIPIGYFTDKANLRRLYAGAFALWSLAQGLTGFAGGLTALVLFRIILGVGESIYLPGGTKIVSLLFSARERGLPSGLFDMGTRTGLVLDGILIPWLLVHYGWRRMFMIVGFSALLWLIPWLLIYPRNLQSGNSWNISKEIGQVKTGRPERLITFNRNLLGLCLGFFCFDYYWYLLLTWLPDYLVTVHNLTILKAGLFASIPYCVFGISQPLGGWIGDILSRRGWSEMRARKSIIAVAFGTGLFLIPAARVVDAGPAILLIMCGSLVGLATANMLVMLQSSAPVREVGIWTGVYNFTGNLAGSLAPLLTGFLIAKTGSYHSSFGVAVAILLAGLLSFIFLVRSASPSRESPPRLDGLQRHG